MAGLMAEAPKGTLRKWQQSGGGNGGRTRRRKRVCMKGELHSGFMLGCLTDLDSNPGFYFLAIGP